MFQTVQLSNFPISWCSKKQTGTTSPSREIEYISTNNAAYQEVWMQFLLIEMKINKEKEVKHIIL